jgi:uncharacterized protein (UPF0333 family)
MKGLTSIELAILLAIIIVIAVAVGWYMYTTFVASTTSQAKLIVSAAILRTNGTLYLTVTNPGPAATVTITSVYVNGTSCTISGTSGATTTIAASAGAVTVTAACSSLGTLVPGTTLNGYVVLSTGTTFPFVATVT